ncbi:hypothetical protein E4191_05700 [Paracoccus liaowanqingii]|uniref:Uncharacterized protein n=1 Tax=Paracoccus liaowanqingii TaxID=2560053 RepID=A0A4P7HJK5_9RHOB|nr:hypothetical protein [Paracoccus liaowanqingii]QBX34265.1 hypothetical protein E4191_05700 [Paracoccus liaowanqingii]
MADPAVMILFGAMGVVLLGLIGWFCWSEGIPLRTVAIVSAIIGAIYGFVYYAETVIRDPEIWAMFVGLLLLILGMGYGMWLIRRGKP